MSYDDEADYVSEFQRPECPCKSCRSLGWFEQESDCIWFRSAD